MAGLQTEPVFVAPHLELEETVPGHADDVLRLGEGDATAEGDGGRLGEDAALHRHLGRHPGLAGGVHTSVSSQQCSGDRVGFAGFWISQGRWYKKHKHRRKMIN